MWQRAAFFGGTASTVLVLASWFSPVGIESDRRAFRDALFNAQRQYNATATKASAQYLDKLRAEVEAETKAGHLDQALALRNEADRLEKAGPPLFGDGADAIVELTAFVPGTWNVVYIPNQHRRKYEIQSNGDVTCAAERLKGRIRRREGSLVLDFGDGLLERLTFASKRLFIEHFNPKDAFPNRPFQIGLGEAENLK